MTATATPPRTTDQRFAALARANEIRTRRAQLKRDIKAGRIDLPPLILDPPPYLLTARLVELVEAVPSFGRTKAARAVMVSGIATTKTLGGLSDRQRKAITSLLREQAQQRAEARRRRGAS